MIERQEVMSLATDLSLAAGVIEKDYVLGWILAGIYADPELAAAWVFKGGTCLKKCFFETYRFSEDLDFTVSAEAHLSEAFLKDRFSSRSATPTRTCRLAVSWLAATPSPRSSPRRPGRSESEAARGTCTTS